MAFKIQFNSTSGHVVIGGGQYSTDRAGNFESVNVGTSAPSSPSTGDIYYNTSEGKLKFYDGSSWK